MQWTYLVDIDRPGPSAIRRETGYEWEGEKSAREILITALDSFLTSSSFYTYTDADGFNHIGWLAGNLYAD